MLNHDIAIIGMNGRLGKYNNIQEFWEGLLRDEKSVEDFPEDRRKLIEPYLDDLFEDNEAFNTMDYLKGSYLNEIDKFDNKLFKLSHKEATLMDPIQRLFLETAWSTIEDAGYGGTRLKGSNTGVYLGLSNTNSIDYIDLVEKYRKDDKDIATPGNLKSITASRINYLLDLKGPSMLIDTACSSSLSAIHIACKALVTGDCEYALAGGIKVNIIPGVKRENPDIDIVSDDGFTRSFDIDATGTGIGEGVAAILLKPLEKAKEDEDHIYAIIKGSAMNQDGASLGITAPNSKAQEEVIVKAWEDANIDPTTVSFIEAHGTGTKLGDPVEIKGIANAFRKFTDKKQFCAIASLKSNMGHLDATAGIAGVIKSVLALKNELLPATVNFNEPNNMINFIDSPVYVNDRLSSWKKGKEPRRCGISSFGLSGTNVHVVLEEADQSVKQYKGKKNELKILTLSAGTEEGVKALVKEYYQLLTTSTDLCLDNMCYTANTGRGMYTHRIAFSFNELTELSGALKRIINEERFDHVDGVFYNFFNLVRSEKDKMKKEDITIHYQKKLTKVANALIQELIVPSNHLIDRLCEVYSNGANINWKLYYSKDKYQKVGLPVYPFERKTCWLEMNEIDNKKGEIHPLIHECLVESLYTDIYKTRLNIKNHWEVGEHRLRDKYLMVGMAYVEIAANLALEYCNTSRVQLMDVVCESALFVKKNEDKEIQIVITKDTDDYEFVILGENSQSKQFEVYCRGIFKSIDNSPKKFEDDLSQVISRCDQFQIKPESYLYGNVKTSERWMNLQKLYIGENEAVGEIQLHEKYKKDKENYLLYPALLDSALNAANSIVGDGTFLPWYYSKISIYGNLPDSFTSYIKLKKVINEKEKVLTFDIQLINDLGEVVVEVEDYAVKQVDIMNKYFKPSKNMLHELKWKKEKNEVYLSHSRKTRILMLRNNDEITERFLVMLRNKGLKVIEVQQGDRYEKVNDELFYITQDGESYRKLFQDISSFGLTHIIHGFSIVDMYHDELDKYHNNMENSINSMFYMMQELMNNKEYTDLKTAVISNNVFEIQEETFINAFGAGLFGMAKSIYKEYRKMKLKCIDTDEFTNPSYLLEELFTNDKNLTAAYRENQRYIAQIEKIRQPIESKDMLQATKKGVVLVTGGQGGIGFELAKYLASKNYKNIALVGRRKEVMDDRFSDMQKLRSSGVEMEYFSADISDFSQMEKIVSLLREKHGNIIGVIHSAGLAGSGVLVTKRKDVFDTVIRPKILGTLVLNELCQNDQLDFFVSCSSLTAEFGSLGQADYAAGNAFLTAYTYQLNRKGIKALTIDWCGWNESGMALKYGINDKENTFRTINNAEGVDIFGQLFLSNYKRVLVIEQNEEITKDNRPLHKKSKKDYKGQARLSGDNTRKVILTGKREEDITELEKDIGEVWSNTLGDKEIDVRSKFFEIGGDSILATYLLRKVNGKWKDAMDITDIFNYSTVTEMASFIETKLKPKMVDKKEDFDDILSNLASGKISIDEAQLKIR